MLKLKDGLNISSSMVAVLLLILTLISTSCDGVRFYLAPGQKRCFTQELPTTSKIHGDVQISGSKDDMDIDVWITTLQGKVLYHKCSTSHGKLSFNTPAIPQEHEYRYENDYDHDMHDEEDTYRICIEHQQPESTVHAVGTARVVKLRLLGVDEAGLGPPHRAASASDTDRLINKLESIHKSLITMTTDLSSLKQSEQQLTGQVSHTASRISKLSAMALIIIGVTSTLQYRYYKYYLKYKKVC